MQVDCLVFHAFLEPFDKHVIDLAAVAIHADLDAVALHQIDELDAGELTALIRIEDLRRAMALKAFLDGRTADLRSNPP